MRSVACAGGAVWRECAPATPVKDRCEHFGERRLELAGTISICGSMARISAESAYPEFVEVGRSRVAALVGLQFFIRPCRTLSGIEVSSFYARYYE